MESRSGISKRQIVLILVLLGFLVYGRSLFFDFLPWDDDEHILRRPPLELTNLAEFLTQPYYGLYIPVTSFIWGLIGAFFQFLEMPLDPFVYHALNLILHLLNSYQVYELIDLILGRSQRESVRSLSIPALSGALLFLVHPMQTAAVSWISGGRDLLSALFGLAAVRTFLSTEGVGGLRNSIFYYLLSVLSKPSSLVLPVGMLIMRPESTLGRTVRKHFVWLALCAAISVWMIYRNQQAQSFAWMPPDIPWKLKPWIAIDALEFYLQKFLFPVFLSNDYGRTAVWVERNISYLSTGVFAGIVGALSWRLSRTLGPEFRKGLLWCLVMLFPVLGWISSAQQALSTVVDHYLYFPMVGLCLCLAVVVDRFSWKKLKFILIPGLIAFTGLSAVRSEIWKNEESFFGAMLKSNPESVNAHLGMGNYLLRQEGRDSEVLEHFRKAYQLAPLNTAVLAQYALSLERKGDYLTIIREFQPIMEIQASLRGSSIPHGGMSQYWVRACKVVADIVAASLMRQSKLESARNLLCFSFRLDPTHPRTIDLWKHLGERYRSQLGISLPEC